MTRTTILTSKDNMNSLVGYDSSDEENDIQPEKPAKMAKIESTAPLNSAQVNQTNPHREGSEVHEPTLVSPTPPRVAEPTHVDPAPRTTAGPSEGPSAGPTAAPERNDEDTATTPFSPYTYERQRLRELTMPPVPNFDIPDSPPPAAANSEEAAALAATTKKFERFLELKKQGVHFNERLQKSTSLRNPSLLPKLMDFAGITREESYESSLSDDVAVATRWPEECYVENLMRLNERREKKTLAERERVDFVPASKSADSSAAVTPASDTSGQRKSRFDKR